jgi:hypothetical protein
MGRDGAWGVAGVGWGGVVAGDGEGAGVGLLAVGGALGPTGAAGVTGTPGAPPPPPPPFPAPR